MSTFASGLRALFLVLLAAASLGAAAQRTGVSLISGFPGAATAEPGLLRVALPVKNQGRADALDLQVSVLRLDGLAQLAPGALPVALGDLPAGATLNVQASFDRSTLAAGSRALLRVTGSYRVGSKRYGFTINRIVTLPADAPGTRTLNSVVTAVTTIDPGRFPVPLEMPIKTANPNPPGPAVPLSPARVLLPVTSGGSEVNTSGGQPPGTGVPSFSFGPGGRFTGVTGNPPDPNGASGGGVILTTVNTTAAISLDGGVTFTNINPYCMFGYVTCDAAGSWAGADGAFGTADDGPFLIDGNLCCDQAVVYVPAIDRFVWLMQTWPDNWRDGRNRMNPPGNNRVRMVVVSPQDVRNWANGAASSWVFFDLSTALFGLGANQWLDYPSLTVGDRFLYMSIDQVGTGLLVARMPLNQIANVGTVTVEWTTPSDGALAYGSHLMLNTRDVMYWAGHNGTDKLRVFDMPEATNQYGWRDSAINSYSNTDYSSTTPSGTNWLMGSSGWGLENVLGAAWRRPIVLIPPGAPPPPDELWFAWGAGRDNSAGRAQPYVKIVRLNSTDFALAQEIHVWNASFAFNYPVLNVNQALELGINLGVGGGTLEAVTAAGFIGDFVVYVPASSDCSQGRFGDWLGLRRSGNNAALLAATGYRHLTVGGNCTYDPTYNEFGRFCDVNPNDRSCQVIVR